MAEEHVEDKYIKCSKCKCKYMNDDKHIKTDFGYNRLEERFKTCTKCRTKSNAYQQQPKMKEYAKRYNEEHKDHLKEYRQTHLEKRKTYDKDRLENQTVITCENCGFEIKSMGLKNMRKQIVVSSGGYYCQG